MPCIKQNIMNAGKAILGVLAGIAAGTVLGALLAPNKEARKKKLIQKKGEDLADALSRQIDEKFDALISGLNKRIKQDTTASSNIDSINQER
jgi:gas vesicle protein